MKSKLKIKIRRTWSFRPTIRIKVSAKIYSRKKNKLNDSLYVVSAKDIGKTKLLKEAVDLTHGVTLQAGTPIIIKGATEAYVIAQARINNRPKKIYLCHTKIDWS